MESCIGSAIDSVTELLYPVKVTIPPICNSVAVACNAILTWDCGHRF